MSSENNFLTIPSRQSFFTTIRNGRAVEGSGSSPEEDEDEEEVDETRLIPRSSPVPRKRGLSIFDETAEYMKMRMGLPSRRVSFADAGELVQVREFVAFESDEGDESEQEQEPEQEQAAARYSLQNGEPIYSVRPDFHSPSRAELLLAVRTNKVELEKLFSTEDEPMAFTGLIRVLNISFHKSVYVRFTMDGWKTYFDCPAEYLHGSNDVETDQFTFKLAFAQPYIFPGARIDFVVRYESAEGDYWANNSGKNYSVVLNLSSKRQPARGKEPSGEVMKGILKATSYRMQTDTKGALAVERGGGDARSEQAGISVLPQIIHPEIDVENVGDTIFSPPSKSSRMIEPEDDTFPSVESFKEQPPQFSSATEELTPLTIQPPASTPEVKSNQKPDLEKEHSLSLESGNDATSTLNITINSQHATEMAPSSYVESKHSTSQSSQVTEYDPEISHVVKASLQQVEVQPKTIVSHSQDSMDPDEDGKIQEQQTIAPSDFRSPEAEESNVKVRQEVGDCGSGSLRETQDPSICPCEGIEDFVIMAEEVEVMRIPETRLGLESDQPGTGALTVVPTTSGTCFGSDGRRVQCHANSDTEPTFSPSHLRSDLQRKMDDPIGISETISFGEAHETPTYKFLEEESLVLFGITSEATASLDIASKVGASPGITSEFTCSRDITGKVSGVTDEISGLQDVTIEPAGLRNVSGEVIGPQGIIAEHSGSHNAIVEVAGLQTGSQDVSGEVAGSLDVASEVKEFQNVTSEVTGFQDITRLQNNTGKVTGWHNVTDEVSAFQKFTGEVSGLQDMASSQDFAGEFGELHDITANATGSKDLTAEVTESQDIAAEVTELQNVTGEVAGSQGIAGEVTELQNVIGVVAGSQGIAGEVTESQDITAEVAELQSVTSEVAGSQGIAGEVTELQNVTGEVAGSQGIAGEVTELQSVISEDAGSQKIADEVTEFQNVIGEVAGSRGFAGEVAELQIVPGEVAGSQNIAEVTELQNVPGEVAGSQKIADEVTELQNVTGEVAGSQGIAGEVTELQSVISEDAGSQKIADEVTELQNVTGEVGGSQGIAGEVTELQNDISEDAGSQKTADEVTEFQNVIGEVAGSRGFAGEVTALQNVPGEVAGSQNIADEVTEFQSVISEVAGSQNIADEVPGLKSVTAEVAGSQDIADEVPGLKSVTAEVAGSQDITNGVAGPPDIRGEVLGSPGVTGEITLSGITGDVTGSLCITANPLSSAPAASGIFPSAEKNDIPVLGDILAYPPETRVITHQNSDLSLNQQIFMDCLVSEATMSEVLMHQAFVKAFVTLVIEVCLVTVITNPSTFLIIGIFLMLHLL